MVELGEWGAAVADPDEKPPDRVAWTPVEVPGSPPAFAGAEAVVYRTTFPDPRGSDTERALLDLRGLYAHARIWLNGTLLGSHDAYFVPFRRAFEPAAENELLVTCRAPEDPFGGVHDTALVAPERSVPGILWGASVEAVPANFVADLAVRPRGIDPRGTDAGDGPGRADAGSQSGGAAGDGNLEGPRIDVTVTVNAGTDLRDRIALSSSPVGFEGSSSAGRIAVDAAAGERVRVEGSLPVREPERWWPRGFGEPRRYAVRASLGGSEQVVKTGFRTVAYGEDGLVVNGQRVPARGFESLPGATASAGPGAGDRATSAVERAAAANANLLRPHAHVPPPAFHEAAAAAGVLVHQPLPYCAGEFDVERGRAVARALGAQHGHRPSLVAFGVPEDSRRLFGEDRPADDPGWRSRRALDPTLTAAAAAVTAALPDGYPAFPLAGLPGTAERYPDWEPEAVAWVLDSLGHLGDVEALTRCLVAAASATGGNAKDASNAGASAAASSDGSSTTNASPFPADTEWLPPPGTNMPTDGDSPAEDGRAAALTLKTVVETLRCSGSELLTALDLRAATTDDGRDDPSGDGRIEPFVSDDGALAASFAPAQAFLDEPTTGSVGVTVVNDTPELVAGRLDCVVGDDGDGIEVAVDPLDSELVGRVTIPDDATRVELSLAGRQPNVYRL
jgi:beta-mannosidase